MEIGEIIGVLFLLIVFVYFGRRIYLSMLCPGCGAFRSIETVEIDRTVIDDEVSNADMVFDLLDHHHKSKASRVEWVDRCKECAFEVEKKGYYSHN